MMSTLFWVISCWATWAARESLDWLSAVKISTVYFFPPMARPLANASRTFFSTNGFAVANAASGPVTGLMKPIFMVPVLVELPPLRPLLQAARPSPAAPVIPPTKARRLSPGPPAGPAPACASSSVWLTSVTSCAPMRVMQHRRRWPPVVCRTAPGSCVTVHAPAGP
jgi:hypothetical protein